MAVFDTPEPISAMIEVPLGSIHVIAGDRAETTVVVNATDRSEKLDVEAADRTSIELSDGRLIVKTPKPRGLGGLIGVTKSGSVDMTIELPRGSRLETDTGFTDLRVDGPLGDAHVRSGAGDVRLDSTGNAIVRTGAGSVTVTRIDGDAEVAAAGEMQIGRIGGRGEIQNLNGKTWVGEIMGRLKVKSANGDISVDRAHSGVTAKTANGSIRIGEVVAGPVSMDTGSGGLEVGIPDGTAAWVDASTRFGRVHNSLDTANEPEASGTTVEIRARTSFGDIVINRSYRKGEE